MLGKARRIYTSEGLGELLKRGVGSGSRVVFSPYRYLKPLDSWLGCKLYKNMAGFHNNVGGSLAVGKNRYRSSDPFTDKSGSAEHLREHGYVELGDIYPSKLIDQVISEYTDHIPDVVESTDGEQRENYIANVEDPRNEIPTASELINDEVKAVLRSYYGSYFQILNYQGYRTHHIPEEIVNTTEVYNNYWHSDGTTTDHLKLFVCLNEVTESDGPLHLVPKADTRRIAEEYPGFDREKHGIPGELVDERATPVTLTGPPGTAMIANTQLCLHRAGVPAEGHMRDILQFYIAPASKPLPEDWHEREFEIARRHVWDRLVRY